MVRLRDVQLVEDALNRVPVGVLCRLELNLLGNHGLGALFDLLLQLFVLPCDEINFSLVLVTLVSQLLVSAFEGCILLGF